MSCRTTNLLAGLARDCSNNMGGIKKLYAIDADDVTSVAEDANGVVQLSGGSKTLTLASSKHFVEYYLPPESASLVITPTVNPQNGNAYVTSVLTFNMTKMNATKRVEINTLMLGNLHIIAEDNNGVLWYLGVERPVEFTGGAQSQTGTAYADLNAYGAELTYVSLKYPPTANGDVPLT